MYKKIQLEINQLFEKKVPGKVWLKDFFDKNISLQMIIDSYVEIYRRYDNSEIDISITIPVNLKYYSGKNFVGIKKIKNIKSNLNFNDAKITIHSKAIQSKHPRIYPLEFHRFDISNIIDEKIPENILCMYFEVRDNEEFDRYIMIWNK
jgi:hypothetical protein